MGTVALSAMALSLALGFRDHGASTIEVDEVCVSQAPPPRVVLITLDGVRWQDVYEGTDPALLASSGRGAAPATAAELTPNIHELIRRGAALGAPGHGAAFSSSGPNFVSLPGYREILSGSPATCQENDCTELPSFTLLDGFAARFPSSRVAAFSSWTNIEHAAASSDSAAIVSAGRSGGLTRGALSADPDLRAILEEGAAGSADPVGGDYRSDENTARLALAYLASQSPAFMFVSLGDADEHAHHGDYKSYLGALKKADAFVGDVIRESDAARAHGIETMIIVTADHGRSDDFMHHGRDWPESARNWLVAAGGPVPEAGYVSLASPRALRDIAPTIAAVTGIEIEMTESSGTVLHELAPMCAPVAGRAHAPRLEIDRS
ncbi:MAG: hypothetical protein HOV80_27430 [Polyangiaceae bacterium]|nr:hypothetical protein [Polyangiaceae bacterium]